jgi:hypothetical protein
MPKFPIEKRGVELSITHVIIFARVGMSLNNLKRSRVSEIKYYIKHDNCQAGILN